MIAAVRVQVGVGNWVTYTLSPFWHMLEWNERVKSQSLRIEEAMYHTAAQKESSGKLSASFKTTQALNVNFQLSSHFELALFAQAGLITHA